MSDGSVTHSTFTVERHYPHPPSTVFGALADPAKKRRWFADSDQNEVEAFESDFRVGGAERLRYRFVGDAPIRGMTLTHEGRYEEIVPDSRVISSGRMLLDDTCFSCSLVTLELIGDAEGTRLVCTFQGAFFGRADGPEIRKLGWETLLDRLGETLG